MSGVLGQSAVLFLSNVLLVVGGYGFKVYLARKVGAEGIGLFTLGETLISFVLLATLFELPQAAFRFIPAFVGRGETARVRRLVWAALWHATLFGVIGGAFVYLTRHFWAERVFNAAGLAPILA